MLGDREAAGLLPVDVMARHNSDGRFKWCTRATAFGFMAFAILRLYLGHFSWRQQTVFWLAFFSFVLVSFGLWMAAFGSKPVRIAARFGI